ncbi:MAG TPA: DegT/DnrJ/EryC1/StrS family aminotransferase [Terriglobales bacterium]|nr:DegT/DnrJ/EryC1/StrS family aminotransferase [Terriglobales bacterium]
MSQRPSASLSRSPAESKRFDAVPMLDLHRQYKIIREQVLAAIERVCASQRFILGAEVEALEHALAAFTGAAAAVACASGTDALWLALIAVGVQPGDAVITTPFSFFASASSIARAGARPVFVDINPDTFNIDPAQVRAKLRDESGFKFAAVLPVHLYGQCADMDSLQASADEYGIPLVEDAAQAIGAPWKDRRAGSMGRSAAFSFYPSKNLSAYGDAGLVTTNDKEIADRIRRLRNHGSPKRYYHDELGANSRMDDIQAAVLRVKLPHLSGWNSERQARAATYDQLFADAGLISPPASAPVRLPQRDHNAGHIFHQYVVRATRRDELRKFLAERKIGTEIYYPVPLHMQACFNYLGYNVGDLPAAERAAREVLALPMFPELTESEQRWVVDSIAEFYS